MTETPGPTQGQQQEAPPADPNRINTEHLRDYTALRRSRYDRKIAGVAGGLARHLNIDPVIVRVVFVVLCFFGGAGFVLYGAAWLLVPEDDGSRATFHTSDSTRNLLLILAAVFAGLLLLGDSWGGFGFPWPLAIIALIVFAVLMSRDNEPDTTPPAAYQPSPAMQYSSTQYGWQPVAPTPAPSYVPRKKKGPILFGYTIALIAVGLGSLGLYDALADNPVDDAAYPALALAITGGMLVIGSFFGRAGGLILVGIVAAFALAGTSIVDPQYDGDRTIDARPTSTAEVLSHYEVPAGQITLDLTGINEVTALDGREIELTATAGEVLVILPRTLSAHVEADIDFGGEIEIVETTEGGFGREVTRNVGDAATTIDLDINLKFGLIEVRYAA